MYAYIGCRTTRRRAARGRGIEVYRVSGEGREWSHVQTFTDLTNPSYLAINDAGDRLYCIHGDRSDISAFAISAEDGTLSLLNQRSTGGANPVHLALDPTQRYIVISNHLSSSLAVMALEEDGSLGERVQLVELEGTPGPHRVEQMLSKPHANPFTCQGRFVVVPDKGLDCLFIIPFDPEQGRLDEETMTRARLREGAGPRHIAFHPWLDQAYVINELDATLTRFHLIESDAGGLEMVACQRLSSVEETWCGDNRAAAVIVDVTGRHVFVSNRGDDSIGIYDVLLEDEGRLQWRGSVASGGKTPRYLGMDPLNGHLHIANEDSDCLVSGIPGVEQGVSQFTQVHQLETPSPVCVVFRYLS